MSKQSVYNKLHLTVIFTFVILTTKAELTHFQGYYPDVPKSSIYEIRLKQAKTITSNPVFVSNCNIYDPGMPGSQPKDNIPLTEYKGRSIHYTSFSFSDSVIIEVKLCDTMKVPEGQVRILPERFGIKAIKSGKNKFSFTVKKTGQYSVEIGENGYKNGLLIFANPLEGKKPVADQNWEIISNSNPDTIKKIFTSKTSIWFTPGTHNIGVFKIPAHIKNIYLAEGAWVYGSFIMDGADKSNVKIFGRGILSGAKLHFRESHQIEAINGANNITVSGITITDYSYFAIRLLGKNNLIEWTKITGGWIWNCDGIAAWEGSTIKNCFIWANDDNIKIYEDNITVENVVCWQLSNGAIFQLNWGNMKAKNCVIRNVDIVRAEWHDDRANNGIISCRSAGGANSGFLFENIYTDNPIVFIFRLSPQGNIPHPIENFTFRNWNIQMDITKNKKNYIEGSSPASPIKNLLFENFKINGITLNHLNFMELGRFSIKNADAFIFN